MGAVLGALVGGAAGFIAGGPPGAAVGVYTGLEYGVMGGALAGGLVGLHADMAEDSSGGRNDSKDNAQGAPAAPGTPEPDKDDTPEKRDRKESTQIGAKSDHMPEWGLDMKSAADRARFREIIGEIKQNPDRVVKGDFIGQGPNGTRGPVDFSIKGNDVVVSKPNGDFVTIMKDGINNPSVQRALGFR